MKRFLCMFIASVGMLLASSSLARAQESVYPRGLKSPADIVYGIYTANDAGSCCWVGTRAAVKIVAPAGADTLLLNVYLPDFAVRGRVQSLHVKIDGAAPALRCCLGPGEHEITIPVPHSARGTSLVVTLWPDHTFVPKELGLNEDPRHLSVMVRDIGFLNAATGERLDTAPLPLLSARSAIPILFLCGLAVLFLTLRRPLYGLLALIATDPFLLTYATHGTTITLPKVALVAVALGLIPRSATLLRARPLRSLFLLAGTQLVFALTMLPGAQSALFHGAVAREALKAVEYLLTIVVAYCAYRLDPDEKPLRFVLAATTIAVATLAFAQAAFRIDESEIFAGHNFARIAGPLEGPNQLAGFLDVVIPAIAAFALVRKAFLIEWIAIALGAVACLMTFSRGGVAALCIALVALVALRFLPERRAALGVVLGAAFGFVLTLAFGVFSGALNDGIAQLFGKSGEGTFNGGLGSRVDLWHGAYALWRSHPLFGIGAGNFELAVGRYFPGARTHANGIFFQVLAEQGIVGLVAAFAVTIASVVSFVRRLNEPLVLGACMAAVAMAFHQIVDCMWLFPKVTVIWWLVLASAAAVVDSTAKMPSEASQPISV